MRLKMWSGWEVQCAVTWRRVANLKRPQRPTDARFELPAMTTTSDAELPCVECEEAKRTAAAKAAVAAASEAAAGDHLQLGECAPVYKAWAKCVEANAGQAKACAESLREFQKCHAQLFRGKR